MPSLAKLFRPALHIARLSDAEVARLYPHFRWRVLESTFIGYAVFYFVRNNLPVVSKEMGAALGYTKGQIGDILALTAIAYGVGEFVLGAWSEHSNPRVHPLARCLPATRDVRVAEGSIAVLDKSGKVACSISLQARHRDNYRANGAGS